MNTTRQGAVCAALLSFFILACSESAVGPQEPSLLAVTGPSFNSAGAGPPLMGSGAWEIISPIPIVPISIRVVGNNTIIENEVEIELSGALQGTAVHANRIVINGITGKSTLQNTGEFTGSVVGCAAVESFRYQSVARAQLDPPQPPIGEGVTRIIASKATNDVVLSGVMRWDQDGPGGAYDIRYVCK
jgi:hypothetical protein